MIPHIEEDKINWDYNVPRSLTYEFNAKDSCIICRNDAIAVWCAPYLTAGVPYSRIRDLIEQYFGVIVNDEVVSAHKGHIRCTFAGKEGVREGAIEQMKFIESDLPQQVDEKAAIESSIRSLYARKLYKEKNSEYDKEYFSVVQDLQKFIEMKLKMKNELYDQHIKVSLADIIKLGASNEPTAAGPTIPKSRDGSKQDIESRLYQHPKNAW